eukprot:TRINITY_DN4087_c0_g1_i1.p1 TRINITY_DN4087_c0_g1~~TRINITY_DN4087_c0_g1_i1.p1  ORF type:complete len:303 (-),score=109.28 TRINITY_DN4087_c0_g1_i1:485-1393(-)
MPSGPKRRKAAKKKKETEILSDAPTNSQGNGEKGDEEHDLISQDSGTGEGDSDFSTLSDTQKAAMEDGSENNVNGGSKQETEDEGVTVTVVSVEDPPESKVVAAEHVSQSESSSDEESKPIENHPEGEVGESVGSISIPELISNPVERIVALVEEVKLVEEATPDEIPEVPCDIEVAQVENLEVSEVGETDSTENSGVAQFTEAAVVENTGVTQFTEATVIENTGVVSGTDASEEIEKKVTQLSSEASSENPTGTVESSKETENPVSISTEDPPVVSVLPPVRPTSWKSCCGLFELLRGSNR